MDCLSVQCKLESAIENGDLPELTAEEESHIRSCSQCSTVALLVQAGLPESAASVSETHPTADVTDLVMSRIMGEGSVAPSTESSNASGSKISLFKLLIPLAAAALLVLVIRPLVTRPSDEHTPADLAYRKPAEAAKTEMKKPPVGGFASAPEPGPFPADEAELDNDANGVSDDADSGFGKAAAPFSAADAPTEEAVVMPAAPAVRKKAAELSLEGGESKVLRTPQDVSRATATLAQEMQTRGSDGLKAVVEVVDTLQNEPRNQNAIPSSKSMKRMEQPLRVARSQKLDFEKLQVASEKIEILDAVERPQPVAPKVEENEEEARPTEDARRDRVARVAKGDVSVLESDTEKGLVSPQPLVAARENRSLVSGSSLAKAKQADEQAAGWVTHLKQAFPEATFQENNGSIRISFAGRESAAGNAPVAEAKEAKEAGQFIVAVRIAALAERATGKDKTQASNRTEDVAEEVIVEAPGGVFHLTMHSQPAGSDATLKQLIERLRSYRP